MEFGKAHMRLWCDCLLVFDKTDSDLHYTRYVRVRVCLYR